jgi:hypothetical protein
MADEPIPTSYLREIGQAFRLGSGVLGKSAIAVGILMLVGGVAVYRLKSDTAILVALGVIAAAFFLWFFPVLRFVEKNPEAGLLEGEQWTIYRQFQAAAKGYLPPRTERQPTLAPGSSLPLLADAQKAENEDKRL